MDIQHAGPGRVPDEADQVMIAMRDGISLATDVYRRDDAAAPVVLIRLPYDKNGEYTFMPKIAAQIQGRGYHVVVQDIRGKFRSEGLTRGFRNEGPDGQDTIEWISQQSWCDGSVVMWGDSYFGYTQLAAAAVGHPALKAIAPRVTGTQLARTPHYDDGSSDVEQTVLRAYAATHLLTNDTYLFEPDWSARPLTKSFEEYFAQVGLRSADYDDPPGAVGVSIGELLAARPVPMLFTIGWYDNCAIWSWPDAERLLRDARWSPLLHLRIEGIDHANYRFVDRPVSAAVPRTDDEREVFIRWILEPALAFFDTVLGRSSAPLPARVTYEVMNGSWLTDAAWPPVPSAERVFFVTPEAPGAQRGALSTAPSATESTLSWATNDESFVPSVAPDPFAMIADARDLSADSVRSDVASADSEAFATDTTIAGPVRLRGRIEADAHSVDVFARLLDIAPDGTATLIARGQTRITGAEDLSPFDVRLLHAGYRVRAGHRLRLHLASSDFPDFTPNPGDGSDPWTATTFPRTRTTLLTGTGDGLRLVLRVLPSDAA